MKRKFVKVMFFGALALSTVTYVGCKDYDDDIDNLQTQIDAVKVSLEELQAKVNSGSVITNVAKGENGITVTLSDGKSYELTNGTNGKNGTDADVWTIGEKDGYWYKNGTKTQYKAVGVDGGTGATGATGPSGAPGANGKYYVPNKETGKFDIYQDGKFVETTDISWKTTSEGGMTAILNGNVLTLQGVEGAPDGVTIDLTSGISLSSLAFMPDVVSKDVPYATTSAPFYHIKNYLDETKYNTTTGEFTNLSDWGKSNVVAMNYRLNPEDANVDGKTVFGFIDRKVTTRATGDRTVLLNVDEKKVADGVVVIGATINPAALAQNLEYNIAALQAWYGQVPLTSDYVYVKSTPIDLVLADSVQTKVGDDKATTFYKRDISIKKDGETSNFIKQFVALDAEVNASFKYTSSINLRDYVGLYSNDKDNWLAALGFKGMSYEFSIPKEYLENDDDKTNQQWFIVKDKTKDGENPLENGTIIVNPEVTNGTPTVGRTPVVRVDAFLTSNSGEKKLVASSYIKLEITDKETDPGKKPDYGIIKMSEPKAADYHELEAGEKAFTNKYELDNVNMDYQAINNKIYGTAKLTSATFWDCYGGTDHKYNVLVTVVGKNGNDETLIEEEVQQATDKVINDKGLLLNIKLNNDDATKTSSIKVGINDVIKTQNTYKDVDGKGAKYSVKIIIPSNDNSHGDITLEQVFYVKETCVAYEYNPNYHFDTYNGHANCIVVKGQMANGHWEMSSKISEHFKLIDGKDIFTYYADVNNTKAISFKWKDATGVTPSGSFSTDQLLKLSAAMVEPEIVKQMNYKVTLNNNEECNFNYNVVFVNPFIPGVGKSVSINGNAIGTNTGETKPQVIVTDNSKQNIYSYSSTSKKMELSKVATDTYKLTESIVSVKYEPVEDKAWTDFTSQLTSGSTLSVDPTSGVVTWKNEGTTLAKDLEFKVKATVTFTDLSVVKCYITVNLTK